MLKKCVSSTYKYFEKDKLSFTENDKTGECFTTALNWYAKCKGGSAVNKFDFSQASCENFDMRRYICKRAKQGKKLCERNHERRSEECKQERKQETNEGQPKMASQPTLHDFSSTPCKNFGLNLYDCKRETKKQPKK